VKPAFISPLRPLVFGEHVEIEAVGLCLGEDLVDEAAEQSRAGTAAGRCDRDPLQMRAMIGIVEAEHDRESRQPLTVPQREIEVRRAGHFGEMPVAIPAPDQRVIARQALDRHQRRNVVRRRALDAEQAVHCR